MSVVEPLKALIQQYDGPEKAVLKRNKRLGDYARYRTVKDRGEKPDKRTQEQGEQFLALNETLKIELPKLYGLTRKLAERCLGNFVQQQMVWQTTWQLKMSSILDNPRMESLEDIIQQAEGDLAYTERMALGLGICNRTFLTGTVNLLSPQSSRFSDEIMSTSSSKRPSITSGTGRPQPISINSTPSPAVPLSAEATRSYYHPGAMGPMSPPFESPSVRPRHASHQHPISTPARPREDPRASHSGTKSPEMIPATRSFSAAAPSGTSASGDRMVRPNTGGSQGPRREMTGITGVTSPPLARLMTGSTMNTLSSTSPPSLNLDLPTPIETPLSARPFSGMFSSAMPMPDSPQVSPPTTSYSQQQTHHQPQIQPSSTSPSTYPPQTDGAGQEDADKRDFNVLFLAASRGPYEVDSSIREGGFGYLSYGSGDVSSFQFLTILVFPLLAYFYDSRELRANDRRY